jgi:cytochrome P450
MYRSGAGSETTSTTLMWWMLAMIAFPEAQSKAQAELDSVVGRARLPTFADAPRLPYVSAIIKEVLRWRPVAPLGVPHEAIEDDWYEGMFIPKGATCVANVWQCNHDRAVFGDDADEFRPERHLDDKGKLIPGPAETNKEGHVSFGFGRRICVGKHLANESLFIHSEDPMGGDPRVRKRWERERYNPGHECFRGRWPCNVSTPSSSRRSV